MSQIIQQQKPENILSKRKEIEKLKTELETLINTKLKCNLLTEESTSNVNVGNNTESVTNAQTKVIHSTPFIKSKPSINDFNENVYVSKSETKVKARHYDPEAMRAFIKQQKIRRKQKVENEQLKKKENDEIRKKKLEELRQRTLQLVSENVKRCSGKKVGTKISDIEVIAQSSAQHINNIKRNSIVGLMRNSRKCKPRSFVHEVASNKTAVADSNEHANTKRSSAASRDAPNKVEAIIKTDTLQTEKVDIKSTEILDINPAIIEVPQLNLSTDNIESHNSNNNIPSPQLISVALSPFKSIPISENESQKKSTTPSITPLVAVNKKDEMLPSPPLPWLLPRPDPFNILSTVRRKLFDVNETNVEKIDASVQCKMERNQTKLQVELPIISEVENLRTFVSHERRGKLNPTVPLLKSPENIVEILKSPEIKKNRKILTRNTQIVCTIEGNEENVKNSVKDPVENSESDTTKNIPEISDEDTYLRMLSLHTDVDSDTEKSHEISMLNRIQTESDEALSYNGSQHFNNTSEKSEIDKSSTSLSAKSSISLKDNLRKEEHLSEHIKDLLQFNDMNNKSGNFSSSRSSLKSEILEKESLSKRISLNKSDIKDAFAEEKLNVPSNGIHIENMNSLCLKSRLLFENNNKSDKLKLSNNQVLKASTVKSDISDILKNVTFDRPQNSSVFSQPFVEFKRNGQENSIQSLSCPNYQIDISKLISKTNQPTNGTTSNENTSKLISASIRSRYPSDIDSILSHYSKRISRTTTEYSQDFTTVTESEELKTLNEQKHSNVKELSCVNYQRGDWNDLNVEMNQTSAEETTLLSTTVQSVISKLDNTAITTPADPVLNASLGMFDQMIKDEEKRFQHLKTVLKLLDKAVFDKTKGQLTWLEIQKQRLRENGHLEDLTMIKKKQRGILIKLQQERHEMQRLKQVHKQASKERKNALREQRNIIKHQLASTDQIPAKIKRLSRSDRRQSGPLKVYRIESNTEHHVFNLRLNSVNVNSQTMQRKNSITEETNNLTTSSVVTQLSGKLSSGTSPSPIPPSPVISGTNDNVVSDTVALRRPSNSVPVERIKQTLLMKEAALEQRQKAAEDLLEWHKRVENREAYITNLEKQLYTKIVLNASAIKSPRYLTEVSATWNGLHEKKSDENEQLVIKSERNFQSKIMYSDDVHGAKQVSITSVSLESKQIVDNDIVKNKTNLKQAADSVVEKMTNHKSAKAIQQSVNADLVTETLNNYRPKILENVAHLPSDSSLILQTLNNSELTQNDYFLDELETSERLPSTTAKTLSDISENITNLSSEKLLSLQIISSEPKINNSLHNSSDIKSKLSEQGLLNETYYLPVSDNLSSVSENILSFNNISSVSQIINNHQQEHRESSIVETKSKKSDDLSAISNYSSNFENLSAFNNKSSDSQISRNQLEQNETSNEFILSEHLQNGDYQLGKSSSDLSEISENSFHLTSNNSLSVIAKTSNEYINSNSTRNSTFSKQLQSNDDKVINTSDDKSTANNYPKISENSTVLSNNKSSILHTINIDEPTLNNSSTESILSPHIESDEAISATVSNHLPSVYNQLEVCEEGVHLSTDILSPPLIINGDSSSISKSPVIELEISKSSATESSQSNSNKSETSNVLLLSKSKKLLLTEYEIVDTVNDIDSNQKQISSEIFDIYENNKSKISENITSELIEDNNDESLKVSEDLLLLTDKNSLSDTVNKNGIQITTSNNSQNNDLLPNTVSVTTHLPSSQHLEETIASKLESDIYIESQLLELNAVDNFNNCTSEKTFLINEDFEKDISENISHNLEFHKSEFKISEDLVSLPNIKVDTQIDEVAVSCLISNKNNLDQQKSESLCTELQVSENFQTDTNTFESCLGNSINNDVPVSNSFSRDSKAVTKFSEIKSSLSEDSSLLTNCSESYPVYNNTNIKTTKGNQGSQDVSNGISESITYTEIISPVAKLEEIQSVTDAAKTKKENTENYQIFPISESDPSKSTSTMYWLIFDNKPESFKEKTKTESETPDCSEVNNHVAQNVISSTVEEISSESFSPDFSEIDDVEDGNKEISEAQSEKRELNIERAAKVLVDDVKQPVSISIEEFGSTDIVSELKPKSDSISTEEELKSSDDDDSLKKNEKSIDIVGVSHVDVRKRVSEILADATSPRGSNKSPRVQDLYITAYDVTSISPENTPELDISSLENHQEPEDARKEAPYRNEAEELLRKQLEIEQEIKQLERQQQNIPYLFMREIPNKPPPPYKPPEFPVKRPANSVVPVHADQVTKLIDLAADLLYPASLDGTLPSVTTVSSNESLTSQQFVFDLCKEIALDVCKPNSLAPAPSWCQPKNQFNMLVAKRPVTRSELVHVMNERILRLLDLKSTDVKDSAIVRWSRKKRDHVDEILVLESQAEEVQWTDYDADEQKIKDDLTDDILNMLISETAHIMSRIIWKKQT